jgi:sec-independent protein translocase protein TatB
MFDIGFAELLIIGVVALLVIGPERLPDAVRTSTAWLSRLRRGFNDIKQEVQQELHNDAVLRDLKDTGDTLRRETQALGRKFSQPLDKPLDKPLDEPLDERLPAPSADPEEPPVEPADPKDPAARD